MTHKTAALFLLCALAACASTPTARVVAVTPPAQCPSASEPEPELSQMNLDQLDGLLRQVDPSARRQGGAWELDYRGVTVTVITDARADRMRMVVPVASVGELSPDHVQAIMVANFHTALDARYAVGEGVLFSTFIHRLSTLHELDVESAVRQTATLAATFGSSYSSGELIFGG